jgi:hypothetical protein
LVRALALGGNTHDVADVAEAVKTGLAQLWTQGESVVVSEHLRYPKLDALRLWLAAGQLPEVLAAVTRAEAWAIEQGCARLELSGRAGWKRLAPALGWRPTGMTYRKDLR